MQTITLKELFEGLDDELTQIVDALRAGTPVFQIAEQLVKPHITAIGLNAGTDMDPAYVAYMVQYAISQTKPS